VRIPLTAYRPDVDGLRALAVSAVVLFHLAPGTLPGGYLGVDVFFVISGYLISGMILGDLRAGRFSILEFYLRRVRRILPALLAMLVGVSLLALLILMPDELQQFAGNVTASALFVPNLALAREAGYFDASAAANPLLHLWSLGVEEQFYLVWPAALMLLVPRVSLRTVAWVMVGIVIASFALQLALAPRSPSAAFYLPFTRFWQLMAGALLATREMRRAGSAAIARAAWLNNSLSVSGLALVAGGILLARGRPDGSVALAVMATLGAALFIASGRTALPNRTLFSWKPVVYVGLISYPLYLWHWPPLSFLHIMEMDRGPAGLKLQLVAVAFAVAAAMATYHFIELPIRRRRNLRRLGVRLVSLLGAAAVGGVVVAGSGGLPGRTPLDHNPFLRTEAMRREDRCSDLYGQPQEYRKNAFCVRNDYEHAPDIVLLGDSHAGMLVSAMREAYPGVSILQIGASACPYLRNTEFWNDHRPRWRALCPPLVASAYRAIGPQTRIVILAARTPMYTATDEEYAATFDYQSAKHFSSPDFPGVSSLEVYERALRRDLALLLENDRDVVLVLPVPALDFSPRKCVRLRPVDEWLPSPDAESCEMPRARIESRLAAARAVMARVAAELHDSDLHVVDPMEALCDARSCHAVIDGQLMYRDDNHLTDEGARLVWSRIRPDGLPPLTRYAYLSTQ